MRVTIPTVSELTLLRAVLSVCLFAAGSSARADLVRLNNGGEVRGTVQRPADRLSGADVTIVTLTGARVTLRRDDVEFVTPRSINIEWYERKLRDLPETVEAHWELAEWCQEHKLSRQRAEQLEAVLRIDPDHEEAHQALRHTFHEGEWLTREELMASRGYTRYKNRWVTQQELDLLQKTTAEREAEQAWHGKIRLWLGWATGRDPDRRRTGAANLAALDDPYAVPALRQFLGEHRDREVRELYVHVLASLPGMASLRPLVERSLIDPEATIRQAALEAIDPSLRDEALELYVGALGSELVVVVRRAAVALRQIGTDAVVDDLIDALVTQHRYKVTVQAQDPSYALGSDGRIGFAGGSTLPPDVEAALRTGQLPYGAVVLPSRTATRRKTITVKQDERNREVREALKALTSQDFGYDERTWKLWRAAHQHAAESPATE